MNLIHEIPVGARLTDSVQIVDASHAFAIKSIGVDGVLQYLGTVTASIVGGIIAAGLGFMPVTYADKFDGPSTVAQCKAIGYLPGGTVWLDVEGVATMNPHALKSLINAWAIVVQAAGYVAGLYVGAGCPLTSLELYQLKVTRYWHSLSRILDRNGQIAEPGCGWCMYQLGPSRDWAGVWVDVNFAREDFRSRSATWMTQSLP